MKFQPDSQTGHFLGIGLQVGVGAALGYFVGSWLDQKYGWGSKGMLTGVLLGVASGMYLLIRDALRINKD